MKVYITLLFTLFLAIVAAKGKAKEVSQRLCAESVKKEWIYKEETLLKGGSAGKQLVKKEDQKWPRGTTVYLNGAILLPNRAVCYMDAIFTPDKEVILSDGVYFAYPKFPRYVEDLVEKLPGEFRNIKKIYGRSSAYKDPKEHAIYYYDGVLLPGCKFIPLGMYINQFDMGMAKQLLDSGIYPPDTKISNEGIIQFPGGYFCMANGTIVTPQSEMIFPNGEVCLFSEAEGFEPQYILKSLVHQFKARTVPSPSFDSFNDYLPRIVLPVHTYDNGTLHHGCIFMPKDKRADDSSGGSRKEQKGDSIFKSGHVAKLQERFENEKKSRGEIRGL